MTETNQKKPRFKVGDRVTVAGQGSSYGKSGRVAEIVSTQVDVVFRYRVTLDDGTTAIFFSFELELIADAGHGAPQAVNS